MIFRRTEGGGGSVVTESPKGGGGGSLKILEGFRGRTTQICLNNASLKAYNINVPILLGDDLIAFAISICSNTTLFKKRKSVTLANVCILIYIEKALF